uniref:Uncharacterized protein n=1 Tax=Eucampia antarctica TaxID=49252 RepID=A0A7S2VZQ6_9STRA
MLQQINVTPSTCIAKYSSDHDNSHLQIGWDLFYKIPTFICEIVRKTEVSVVYSSSNLYSIMAYNVGYHYAVFNQVLTSLDDNFVFSLPRYHGEERSEDNNSYHYALLDWGRSIYKWRDVVVRNDVITLNQPST